MPSITTSVNSRSTCAALSEGSRANFPLLASITRYAARCSVPLISASSRRKNFVTGSAAAKRG